MTEIRIEWAETSPHSGPQSGSVALKTDGTIDGLIGAFRTAVVGMGYSTETAGRLGLHELSQISGEPICIQLGGMNEL